MNTMCKHTYNNEKGCMHCHLILHDSEHAANGCFYFGGFGYKFTETCFIRAYA